MNGVIFTEVLYFFCKPAVCDLRLGHTDTVDFFRTCADRKGCYRKKGRFCLFAGMDCSIRIKREGQLFCFLRNLCPASGLAHRQRSSASASDNRVHKNLRLKVLHPGEYSFPPLFYL